MVYLPLKPPFLGDFPASHLVFFTRGFLPKKRDEDQLAIGSVDSWDVYRSMAWDAWDVCHSPDIPEIFDPQIPGGFSDGTYSYFIPSKLG
jgi:hypothetical protein